MIFKLDGYNDLGKCAYATLLDEFDTEKNKILLRGNEVKISKVEDLFPYLWNIAGCEVRHENLTTAFFFEPGYWWTRYYGNSKSEAMQKLIKRMEKDVAKQQAHLVEINENSSTK